MIETRYRVYDEQGSIVAEYMTLETAMVLMSALLSKYYNDSTIKYTICQEEKVQAVLCGGEQE